MSRKLITIGIAVTVAVSFMFVGFGGVAAHDNGETVGASGHCSDSSNGGGGSVGASENGDYDGTNASEVESTANGVIHYAEEGSGDGDDPCDNHDDSDSYDYVEVHADDFQYCYSEDNSGDNGNYTTSGDDACHS